MYACMHKYIQLGRNGVDRSVHILGSWGTPRSVSLPLLFPFGHRRLCGRFVVTRLMCSFVRSGSSTASPHPPMPRVPPFKHYSTPIDTHIHAYSYIYIYTHTHKSHDFHKLFFSFFTLFFLYMYIYIYRYIYISNLLHPLLLIFMYIYIYFIVKKIYGTRSYLDRCRCGKHPYNKVAFVCVYKSEWICVCVGVCVFVLYTCVCAFSYLSYP